MREILVLLVLYSSSAESFLGIPQWLSFDLDMLYGDIYQHDLLHCMKNKGSPH